MTDTELYNLCESCAKEIEKRIIELNENEITNGDVIKALFPNCYLKGDFATILLVECGGGYISCQVDWWNSPYKEVNADEDNN